MKIVFILLMLIAASEACSSHKRATEWLPREECTCGNPSGAVANTRLWGGGPAPDHYYTWMALIYINLDDGSRKMCGGSLISDDTILTAAHCLEDAKLTHDGKWTLIGAFDKCPSVHHYLDPYSSDPASANIYQYCYTQTRSNYEVILGAQDYLIAEPDQKSFLVKEIILHHKYYSKSVNADYDFGIIKLYNPVTFNGYISPVCLPTKDSKLDSNMKTYLTGWGFNPTESSKLQEIVYDSMTNEECAKKTEFTVYSLYDSIGNWLSNRTHYLTYALTERMTCIGPGQKKGICPGDSGSPSVIKVKPLNYYLQTAIVSRGIGNVCNLKECKCKFGIAVKVQTVIDWIESHITGKRCHKPQPSLYHGCIDPHATNPLDNCDH